MALPKDHWIHKALAKEKTRLKKKGNLKTQTVSPVTAGATSMAGADTGTKPYVDVAGKC